MSTRRNQSLLPERQTEIHLLGWLGQAGDGDILEYHQGFLALDRAFNSSPPNNSEHAELGRLASRTLRLAEQGLVHIVQRRLCRERFSYLAIARPSTATRPRTTQTIMSEENA